MAEKTLQRALDAVALELDASKETSTVVDFGLAAAGTSTPLITQGGADSGWHEVFSLSDGVLLIQAWMGATARLVVNRMWIQTQSNINLSGMALSLGVVEGVGTYAFGEGELALDWCARCGIQPPPSQGGTWSPSTPIANAIRLVREIQLGEVEVKNGKYGISFYFTTPLIIEPGQNIALLCNDPRRNRFGLEATYNQNSPILHIGFNRDGALNEVVSWNNAVYRVILADFSASLPVVDYDEGSLFADIITVDGKKSIMTYRLDGEGNLVFIDLGLKSKDVIVVKKFLAVTPNDGGLIVCSDASVRLFKENKKLFEERVVDAADAGGLLRAQKPAGATDIAGFFGYDDDNAPILKRLSTDGDGKFKVNGDSATFKRNKAGAKEIQLLSDAGANSGIAMDEYVPPATDNHYAQKKYVDGKVPKPAVTPDTLFAIKGEDGSPVPMTLLSTAVTSKKYTFTYSSVTHELLIEKNAAGLMVFSLKLGGTLSAGSSTELFTIPDAEWKPTKSIVLVQAGDVASSSTDTCVVIYASGLVSFRTTGGYIRARGDSSYTSVCQTPNPDATHVLSIDNMEQVVWTGDWSGSIGGNSWSGATFNHNLGVDIFNDPNYSWTVEPSNSAAAYGTISGIVTHTNNQIVFYATNNYGSAQTHKWRLIIRKKVGSGAYVISKFDQEWMDSHVLSLKGTWKSLDNPSWNNNFTNGTYTVESKTGISGLQMITFDYNGSGSLSVDQCSIGNGQTMTLVVDGSASVTVSNNSGSPGTRAMVIAVPVEEGAYVIRKPFKCKILSGTEAQGTLYFFKLGRLELGITPPTGNDMCVLSGFSSVRRSTSATSALANSECGAKWHVSGSLAGTFGDAMNHYRTRLAPNGTGFDIWVQSDGNYTPGFIWNGELKYMTSDTSPIIMIDTGYDDNDKAKFTMLSEADILASKTSTQPSGSR